jgi:hypothetical protein
MAFSSTGSLPARKSAIVGVTDTSGSLPLPSTGFPLASQM